MEDDIGIVQRASPRRASDHLRSFNEPRLTLARAHIHDNAAKAPIDAPAFVLLAMDKVDFLHGRDVPLAEERQRAGGAGEP